MLSLLACAGLGLAPDAEPEKTPAPTTQTVPEPTRDSRSNADDSVATDTSTSADTSSPTDTSTTLDTSSTTDPVDPCGNPAVIPSFTAAITPVLSPVAADADHGSDNLYAPEVVRLSDQLCFMYYGGQGGDGHDRIFLATSTDCAHWTHWPERDNPGAVIDNGSANHVNDPSVVVVAGRWYLYYTVAATAEDDRIHLATSLDGITYSPQGLVLDVGAPGTWDSVKVGRPSVVYRDASFYLYYDGNDGTARHVGLATSADGYTFTRHAANPLLGDAGAVDVDRVGDTWVLLEEGGDGTYASTSADGVAWCEQGQIHALSGTDHDRYGQVTPFLYSADGTSVDALLYGGATDACWCHNRVVQVYPAGRSAPPDPAGGCEACVSGGDCTQACRDGGFGVEGYCAVPGSLDPGACCACVGSP